MRFGISTLLFLIFAASVICGILLHGSFLAFAIGFAAVAILIDRLMAQSVPRTLTVQEASNEADAQLVRNHLVEHGIKAWVESGMAHTFGGLFGPRVVVPAAQADQAQRLLSDLELSQSVRPTPGGLADAVQSHEKLPSDAIPGPFAPDAIAAEEIPWPADFAPILRRLAAVPNCLLLDSARPGTLGRYSFLTAAPFEVIRYRRGRVIFIEAGQPHLLTNIDPISLLSERCDRFSLDTVADLPPFQGGIGGLFSYDLCHEFERLPRVAIDEFELPDLAVGVYDWVLALDHVTRRSWIMATGQPAPRHDLRRARAATRIQQVREWLNQATVPDGRGTGGMGSWRAGRPAVKVAKQFSMDRAAGPTSVTSNLQRDQYLRMVERAIDYIRAGDIYQVNLAQRLLAPLCDSPLELYLRLRERNPAPFAGYFDLGDFAIASASPERFVRVDDDGAVETRPIKGTRPRWLNPEADMYSATELQESAKDRAENVMIVDLLRNDLGRVCEFGSVQVTNPLRLESYEFVHHLVSEVRGRLRPDCGPFDLIRAAFPGGSVTGAPKIRAMEIIAELEPTVRGPYCGSLGYIAFNGAMDSNILIRTFSCSGGWAQFPVGGGIVAESNPDREFEETLHKAEGLIRALHP